MTGSVTLPATGAAVAVDAVGATVVQIIKIDVGPPGASAPLSPTSPMPVVNALGATASNQVLEIAALTALTTALTPAGVAPVLALDSSMQSVVTALATLHSDAGTNHTDLVQLHADVGAAQHADLTAILAKQPNAPALETGNLASILAELILILTKMPATPALDASVQQAVTALGALNTAATTNHTDLVQLHGDVGSTLHNDLAAISAKLITAPATAAGQSVQALEAGGNLAAILAELILILAKQPAINADGGAAMHTQNGSLDATAQATNTALGLLHTDAGTNHSDMVALHTDSATTLHADLTAVLAKLNATLAVSGSFFQTTQPVSGTAAVGSPPTAAPLSIAGVDAFGNKQHLQIVGGRTVVDGSQVTQPVSAATLPLPAGAATSAGQATINADGGSLVHIVNFPALQNVGGTITSNMGTTGGLGLDASLQQIKAAIQATVSLTGTIWYDATVTPPVFFVRRETDASGILAITWETPAGSVTLPTVANLQPISNAQGIANENITYSASAAGSGYVAGDILIHAFGIDTATTPQSIAYSLWMNAGPSVASGTIITAPIGGTYAQATQAISAAALPLPTGAATFAGQPIINADGGAQAHIMNFPAIQPVSAAALPLPAGASTSLNQVTEITALQAIQASAGLSATATAQASQLARTPALGSALPAASTPVTEASISGIAAITIGTTLPAGRQLGVNCTVAGNVTLTFSDASTLTWPVTVGGSIFPWAVTLVSAFTGTATFYNFK